MRRAPLVSLSVLSAFSSRSGRSIPSGLSIAVLGALAPLLSARPAPPGQDGGIPWQRTLTDALSISQATGKPLLVCVNMDDESACEVFANRKYQDRAFIKLVEGFVPVILSPNRHNPRDYDEAGRRIPCPRFGRVTCSEHIDGEPIAFERYFRGERYAPRHVGVAPSGAILFDRYLDNDLTRVDAALRAHGVASADTGWAERLSSRDVRDREQVEAAFLSGRRELQQELLELAASSPAEPLDLIRLGLAANDDGLNALACSALAEVATPAALPLVIETLRRELGERERAQLFEALQELASNDPDARRELRIQTALATPSPVVDLEGWRNALAVTGEPEASPPARTEDDIYARIDALGAELRVRPGDPALLLDLARQSLAAGELMIALGRDPSLFLADAVDLARQASEALADPLAGAAVRAQAEWLLSETGSAAEHAAAAVPLGLNRPLAPDSAQVLVVLARARTSELYFADGNGDEWDPLWLSDALAAYEVLLLHPSSQAAEALSYIDLLRWLGLAEREGRAIQAAIARFPANADVHLRFRGHVENALGILSLEPAYRDVVARDPANAALRWYAAYALLIVAEQQLRDGDPGAARRAYGRALVLFDESVALEPAWTDTTDHFASLALAGVAWISLRAGDHERALTEILEAIRRRPDSALSADGNGRTPLGTLRMLRNALGRGGEDELRARLESEIEEISPELLESLGDSAGGEEQ